MRRALLDGDADADRANGLALLSTSLLPSSGRLAPGGITTTSKYSPAATRRAERAGGVVLDRDLVAGLLLELGHQLQRHRLEGAGGQELEVGGGSAAEAGEQRTERQGAGASSSPRRACP